MRMIFWGTTTAFCLMALAPVSLVFADTPSVPDSILGERVSELFQVGYARGPRAFNETQSKYESLSKESQNDPRIDYAYGLILLKLMKNKEAQEAFLTATKRPGTPYWPGWEALIWSHFISKNYGYGYDYLLEFAKLVTSSEGIEQEKRDDTLAWIGQVMAAIDFSLSTNKDREQWRQIDEKLTDLLGEDASDDYVRGKQAVHAQHLVLEDDIRQTKEKTKKQQEEQLEKRQTRIQQALETVKAKREKLKKTAEEMKSEFADQTAAYQKQMTRLERDFGFVERRSAVLASSMVTLDQEAALLQQRKRNTDKTTANQIDLAIEQIQNQRLVYSAEFVRTTAAAEEIANAARQLSQERAALVDEYQKATGEIVAADASADQWKQRALNQEKVLKKAKATAKPPVPTIKIQAAKTFRTYLDLDLYRERNNVLASFGVTPLGK